MHLSLGALGTWILNLAEWLGMHSKNKICFVQELVGRMYKVNSFMSKLPGTPHKNFRRSEEQVLLV